MKFCTKCGAQVEDGLSFCTSCGEPMNAAETPSETQSVQETPQAQELPQNQTTTPKYDNALINESAEAVSQIKNVVKNVNIKEETANAKGFFADMFSNPIGAIKSIPESGGKHLNIALVVMVIWVAASFINALFSTFFVRLFGWNFGNFLQQIARVVTSTISPIFIVLALSAATYVFFKSRIDKFMPLVITIAIASAPQAIAAVLRIITSLIPGSFAVVGSINALLYLISIVLVYFGIKAFSDQDDESFFKNFVLIQCMYFAARIVLNAFGILI